MDAFECKRTRECGDLCHLLQQQGVETVSPDGNCAAPDFFIESNGHISAELENEPKNPELTAFALASLFNILKRRDNEPHNLDQLISVQYEVLNAHKTMWQAMIDATKQGRKFTAAERDYYEKMVQEATTVQHEIFTELSHESRVQARAAFDSQTLTTHDIVFDEQALRIITEDISNYTDGKHTLVVGDMGISKTNLVQFVSNMTNGDHGKILIAGKGDKMSDEIMGKQVWDAQKKDIVFREAPFLTAIQKGLTVVVDEANGVDPKILMRMHQPLLTKPGESIAIDENDGQQVTVGHGFHVAATANEVSANYKDRNRLDPAFRDRFSIVIADYPDSRNKNPLLEMPEQSLRLAFAAVCNERGVMSQHIDPNDLVKFVRLTHVTQYLYTKQLTENVRSSLLEKGETVSTAAYVSAENPVMNNCISPRSMINTLKHCADGNKPGITLGKKINDLVEGLDQGGATVNKIWAKKALRFLSRANEEQN